MSDEFAHNGEEMAPPSHRLWQLKTDRAVHSLGVRAETQKETTGDHKAHTAAMKNDDFSVNPGELTNRVAPGTGTSADANGGQAPKGLLRD